MHPPSHYPINVLQLVQENFAEKKKNITETEDFLFVYISISIGKRARIKGWGIYSLINILK